MYLSSFLVDEGRRGTRLNYIRRSVKKIVIIPRSFIVSTIFFFFFDSCLIFPFCLFHRYLFDGTVFQAFFPGFMGIFIYVGMHFLVFSFVG